MWYNEPCRAPCVHRELYKANVFTETIVDVVQCAYINNTHEDLK